MKNRKPKRKRIFKRVLAAQIILGLIIILTLNLILGYSYANNKLKDLTKTGFSYVKTISDMVDGDKAISYLDTLEKDAYYNEVLGSINLIQKNSNVKYVYIFVPVGDKLYYIWDATYGNDYFELGDYEMMADNGQEIVDNAYADKPLEELSYTESEEWGTLASAYYPLRNSDGKPVALVGVDVPIEDIYLQIAEYLVISSTAIIIIVIAFYVISFLLLNKIVISPITILKNASKRIIDNEKGVQEVKIDVNNGDELDDLARSFEFMSKEMKDYTERLVEMTSEKERLTAELDVAQKIQANMLPSVFPPYPEQSIFDIYASMDAAREVGGDFYDFFMIDKSHLGLVIADVSGKGVPAALFMVKAKNLLKNRASLGGNPGEILTDVNNDLCLNNDEGFFVTAWFAIFNLKTGEIISANAGHEHPAYMSNDGDFKLNKYKHSLPLAAMEGVNYSENKVQLSPGDKIFVYTDGVTESINSSNEQFGEERLVASLNKNKDSKSKELINSIKSDIKTFSNGQEQFDDITMLCFEYFK